MATSSGTIEHQVTAGGTEETIDTVIIGGGQAGLAAGYFLSKLGQEFVILDANARTGDSWRKRWDSLLLFTPARFNGLPGLPFPASPGTFVTKDEMADYLEGYAQRFELPIRRNTRVERLARLGERFEITTGESRIIASNVIVAMANSQEAWTPPYAKDLDPAIVQMHAAEYKNPSQLKPGRVLIVGVGNSGADIGIEVVKTHETTIAGKESGHVPFRIEPFIARNGLIRLVRFMGHRVLNVRNPIGRKVRPKMLHMAAPLVRVKPKDLVASGIERVGRVAGVRGGRPVLEDGTVVDAANVIWCTGFRPGFSWIDVPILGDRQEPDHASGVVESQPGLYFLGLHFLHSMTSETVTGMPRDAKRITKQVAARMATRTTSKQAVSA